MATIYGTPVILLKKPDTSEQWIINVSPDITSILPSMGCIAGWSNDAYRQITLEKPATGDLLTWLEANAVRLPLEGTWVFNERLNGLAAGGDWDIAFTSNDNSYSKFIKSSDSISYGSTMVYVIPSKESPWINEAYRTITFTEPVQYQGNEEFVKWFTQNAKPLPAKGKTLNEYT